MRTTEEQTEKEILSTWQRWAELLTIPAMLLIFSFFAYHQGAKTGFFTSKFEGLEIVCLYGPMLLSLAAPIIRAVSGRRNPARPLEAATNMFLAIGSLWLLQVFPFNFSHLADALPASLQFVLAWVTNEIGGFVLLLQVVVGALSAVLILGQYVARSFRRPVHPTVS